MHSSECCHYVFSLGQINAMSYTRYNKKNKTNHLVSSNSHPSATANKAMHSLKRGGGGGYKTNGILTKWEAVHPTAASENNSSSGMLITF